MNDLIVTDTTTDVKQTTDVDAAAAPTAWVVFDYQAQFTRYLQEHDKSDATVRAYTIGVRTFAEWLQAYAGEVLDPVRVTPLDVRAFKKYLVEKTSLKTASINNYMAGLRAFCRWAQESGLAEHDPQREYQDGGGGEGDDGEVVGQERAARAATGYRSVDTDRRREIPQEQGAAGADLGAARPGGSAVAVGNGATAV